jgi:hypothetical protein
MVQGLGRGVTDRGGGFGPDEESGAAVVFSDVVLGGSLKIHDASEGNPPRGAVGSGRTRSLRPPGSLSGETGVKGEHQRV